MSVFIGKTAVIETALRYKVRKLLVRLQAREKIPVLERRWIFTGPPGTGKTEMGWLVSRLLLDSASPRDASGEFNHVELEHLNGSNISIDRLRDWQDHAAYMPMMGCVSVKFADEIDGIKSDALTNIRTYLDTMPSHRVFIATTNRTVDTLQEQLQSRFQVFEFEPVPASDITAHLIKTFKLDPHTAASITAGARGNVRAAITDAMNHLDVAAALAEAA